MAVSCPEAPFAESTLDGTSTADRRRGRRCSDNRALLYSADNCLLESSIKKFDERLGMDAVP